MRLLRCTYTAVDPDTVHQDVVLFASPQFSLVVDFLRSPCALLPQLTADALSIGAGQRPEWGRLDPGHAAPRPTRGRSMLREAEGVAWVRLVST